MIIPKAITHACAIQIKRFPLAFGLKYVWYISYVKIEDTAISSAAKESSVTVPGPVEFIAGELT